MLAVTVVVWMERPLYLTSSMALQTGMTGSVRNDGRHIVTKFWEGSWLCVW